MSLPPFLSLLSFAFGDAVRQLLFGVAGVADAGEVPVVDDHYGVRIDAEAF
jgi:hypothetical protein